MLTNRVLTKDEKTIRAIQHLVSGLYYGVHGREAKDTIYSGLKDLSELLPTLAKHKDWKKMCFNFDSKNAQDYLILEPIDLISYDGHAILNIDPNKVTLKNIEDALNADNPVPLLAVLRKAALRKKLTNEWVYKRYLDTCIGHNPYAILLPSILEVDLGRAWNKDDKSFAEVSKSKSLSELVHNLYLGSLFHTANSIDKKYFNKLRKKLDLGLSTLRLSKEATTYINTVFDTLADFVDRMVKYVPEDEYTNWYKIPRIPVFEDATEEDKFVTFAKLNGYDYTSDAKSKQKDIELKEHYENSLKCLLEYQLAKQS